MADYAYNDPATSQVLSIIGNEISIGVKLETGGLSVEGVMALPPKEQAPALIASLAEKMGVHVNVFSSYSEPTPYEMDATITAFPEGE